MHTCTNCAHNAALGGDAASLCTNCGAVAAETASLVTVSVYAAAVLGVGYLAIRVGKALAARRTLATA